MAADAKVTPPKLATLPNCGVFPVAALQRILGVGRSYLSNTLLPGGGKYGSVCEYIGASPAKQETLGQVPYSAIKYYPYLRISISRATWGLYTASVVQAVGSAKSNGGLYKQLPRRLGIGAEAWLFDELSSGGKLEPCNPELLFSNWIGPPSCKGQAAWESLTTVAHRGSTRNSSALGVSVTVVASAEAPSKLDDPNVEQLTKDVFAGRFP